MSILSIFQREKQRRSAVSPVRLYLEGAHPTLSFPIPSSLLAIEMEGIKAPLEAGSGLGGQPISGVPCREGTQMFWQITLPERADSGWGVYL